MKKKIAVIRGDGIGAEIVDAATKVLDAIGEKYSHEFEYDYVLMGGCAIDKYNEPLPQSTIDACLKADSVLLGAVGGPKWDGVEPDKRPEKGLLALRKALGLYANLRPAKLFDSLACSSPLRSEVISGTDVMIVRELTGGIYFGERGGDNESAYDTEKYSRREIERIVRRAFEIARGRNKRVVSVDKANVLASSKLWRSVAEEIAKDYQDIALSHMYVDNAAMQLACNPSSFDVIVTSNMFGDILSDLASACTGSIGMLPSASLSDSGLGLYEPIHGSAPDIAGQNIANPLATILCVAMMLKISFGMKKEADDIERAVGMALDRGFRTKDIANGGKYITCSEMSTKVIENIKKF